LQVFEAVKQNLKITIVNSMKMRNKCDTYQKVKADI